MARAARLRCRAVRRDDRGRRARPRPERALLGRQRRLRTPTSQRTPSPSTGRSRRKRRSITGSSFVTLVRIRPSSRASYPGLDVIDAREGGPLARPQPLLNAIARPLCGRASPADPVRLTRGDERALGARDGRPLLLVRGPLLLGLGAIAYWSLPAARALATLRREIEGITQCVLAIGDGRLRIAKAEGRPAGRRGQRFRYELEDGLPVLASAPCGGAARRRSPKPSHRAPPSQADLARLAGVSASAISQAERGRRGLSLETLLDLALEAEHQASTSSCAGRLAAATGWRAVTIRATPRPTGRCRSSTYRGRACGCTSCGSRRAAAPRPSSCTRASRSSTLATGLVQVLLASGGPVLRQGEALARRPQRCQRLAEPERS